MAGIKRRVLMVDDNPDTVLLLGKIGEILGHHVATATNGPQAMQVAAAFVPEVAVIDLTMPMMGGQELARKLRLAHAETGLKLIALTGHDDLEHRSLAVEAGFTEYLLKPVSIERLEALLR